MLGQRMAALVTVMVFGLLHGCSSEPEEVIVGNDVDGESDAVGDDLASVSPVLPIPSSWWILDANGETSGRSIGFFSVRNHDGFAVVFSDGCTRLAEEAEAESGYAMLDPLSDVLDEAMTDDCAAWPARLFEPGQVFDVEVVEDRLFLEIGGTEIEGVAVVSVSDPLGPSPTTTTPTSTVAESNEGSGTEGRVTTTYAPDVLIDPIDAFIGVPGGRWGDEAFRPYSPDSTLDDDTGWLDLVSVDLDTVACAQIAELVNNLPDSLRATSRDEARSHDLDQVVYDLGPAAGPVADTIRSIPVRCQVFDDGAGSEFVVEPLDVGPRAEAMSMVDQDGATGWFATLHRNNIVSTVMVYETGADPLVDGDLEDFRRLVELAFDALADG